MVAINRVFTSLIIITAMTLFDSGFAFPRGIYDFTDLLLSRESVFKEILEHLLTVAHQALPTVPYTRHIQRQNEIPCSVSTCFASWCYHTAASERPATTLNPNPQTCAAQKIMPKA